MTGRRSLGFTTGDLGHGKRLESVKNSDNRVWTESAAHLICKADVGTSAARRIAIELRKIHSGKVPFISAMPLDDRLDRILASIEGPPETPYEGGIFWITARISPSDSDGIPLLRFHTRIYHPNIDPRGNLCTDYRTKWRSDSNNGWYFGQSSSIWSLGGLLVALCGLLSSPDVEDPLVPEIAQKYLEDYDKYCRAARQYTLRYAIGERPDEHHLLFYEDSTLSPSTSNTGFYDSLKSKNQISETNIAEIRSSKSEIRAPFIH